MTTEPIRILIVEDDTVDRLACRRAIAKDPNLAPLLFETATGGEGLEFARRHRPDCILLDYHLPDMNGLEFLAELADNADPLRMPVLLLTGADSATVVAAALKCGAWDYLGKDYDGQYLELLPAAIIRMLREQKLAEGKRQAEQALRESQAELRLLTGHLERIKEEERKRIAQEIHDELGGLLSGIKAYVSVYIERRARAGEPPEPLLVDAAALADTGFQAVRRIITDLRPSVLDQLGVWPALEWYAGQIEKQSGLKCICSIDASAAAVDPTPEISTMLFRVVQEAMTNAVRHAKASAITVQAAIEDGALMVAVRDDGDGIDSDRQTTGASWGIVGMGERARYFGGELTISGKAGAGTSIILRMPMEKVNGE